MSEVLKAHVRNGQIVLDDPIELPEGASLRVVRADEIDDLELHEAIESGFEDFERGDFVDAKKFAEQLVSSS